MICTVTLNPALDLTLQVPVLNKGSINRAHTERIVPGGKGVNVSLMLKNFGVDSLAAGFAAGGSGEIFCELLQKAGISCAFLPAQGMTRINVKIRAEEETDINGAGADVSLAEVRALAESLSANREITVLVLGGSLPASLPDNAYVEFLRAFRRPDVQVVADVSGKALAQMVKFRPWLVKPNKEELGDAFGVTIGSKESALCYARRLREAGAGNVIVSLGAEGALMADDKGGEYFMDAFKGVSVDTVGAGDSLLGAFLAAYEQGMPAQDCLALGVAAGSATAFRHGLATAEEVRTLAQTRRTEK